MTDREAITYLEAMVYQSNFLMKLREESGEEVDVTEKVLPEAIGIVLKLAKEKSVSDVIQGAIKEE